MVPPIEIEKIKEKLENIQHFIHGSNRLVIAEEDNTQGRIKKRSAIKQLIEAAFAMEDVIDEYMIHEEQQTDHDPGCEVLACDIIMYYIKTIILRRRINHQYGELNSLFHEISKGDGSQIQSSSEQNIRVRVDKVDVVVGFDDSIAKLVDWLVIGEAERTIISVVGMAGIGKTTLAKKVFDSPRTIQHFDCLEWFTVSASYTIEELLRDMLRRFYKKPSNSPPFATDRSLLIDKVRNYLRLKRYVFFFDDVWSTHFWDDIGDALVDNRNGSRIFITTRSKNVAFYSERYSHFVTVHEMQPLPPKQSMELLYLKAFQYGYKENYPKNLEDISYEIVRKCKGLPLAIVTIGSVLSGKPKTAFEWKRFSQNLGSELEENPHLHGIGDIFSLSYDDLPSHLKLCLLYFAIYPQDYEVKSKRLIRHWIAEGFVKAKPERTLEDLAEEYLQELINRSLVQVSSLSLGGKVKGCCVHNLLREMILRKVEDFNFCKFICEDDWYLKTAIIRRLSIATTSNDLIQNIESSHVRSLLFFMEEELHEYLVKIIFTKFKLLKVLDFENSRLFYVPGNLGDLIHLTYLSFRNTELESLPKTIGKLHNLETLDLRQTNVNEIPKEISKFRKLRHLLGNKMSLSHLKGGIGDMESLQTLSEVKIDEDGIELIIELGKLKQLRKLSLLDVREEQGISLCNSINKMSHLEVLYIKAKSEDVAIDLSFVSHPTMLRKLRLHAKLNKLPEWIPKLENLIELSLACSRLANDPLEPLQSLPNLLLLNLAIHSYEGESLHFKKGGFLKLKELGVKYLYNLNSIIIEKGALASLKELTFMNIPNLKRVPSNIDNWKNLEVLNTHFMPKEFEKSIAPLPKPLPSGI
nr:NBS-LRR protein [Cicer arietinum]